MYILAATGAPSFVIHTVVALGAAVVALAILVYTKVRKAIRRNA